MLIIRIPAPHALLLRPTLEPNPYGGDPSLNTRPRELSITQEEASRGYCCSRDILKGRCC